MTAQGVDSVWIWYLGDAAYKATYGRFSDAGDNSWTKDYLQVSGNCRDLLNSKFPTAADGERVDIEYKWPGEAYPGFIKFSVDRHHLSWETKSGAPVRGESLRIQQRTDQRPSPEILMRQL